MCTIYTSSVVMKAYAVFMECCPGLCNIMFFAVEAEVVYMCIVLLEVCLAWTAVGVET